jgi:WD40 repeat protein
VAFSPDGETLAFACGLDVKLWDVPGKKERRSITLASGRRVASPVLSVAFSPDGTNLAVGWESVKLCDAASGKEVLDLNVPHASGVYVAFRSDAKALAAGGLERGKEDGGFVRVWDLRQKPPGK